MRIAVVALMVLAACSRPEQVTPDDAVAFCEANTALAFSAFLQPPERTSAFDVVREPANLSSREGISAALDMTRGQRPPIQFCCEHDRWGNVMCTSR